MSKYLFLLKTIKTWSSNSGTQKFEDMTTQHLKNAAKYLKEMIHSPLKEINREIYESNLVFWKVNFVLMRKVIF